MTGKSCGSKGIRSGVTRYRRKDHGGVEQNLRYRGQYLDGETGCTTICTGTMIRMSGGSW